MAVTSRYGDTYTRDIVTVERIGAIGATCRTSYGAEITVQWGSNLPSPVPQIGERWYVNRISPSKWSFDAKITGKNYNMIRYAMELEMQSCIGRERSTVDDIADAGVTEIYLTVAEGGTVYWDSEIAGDYGLYVYKNGKDADADCIRQVVSRCVSYGIAVVFVIDCNLWSDVNNSMHNAYQQSVLSEEYIGQMGWYAMLDHVWDDINNYTWDRIRGAGTASVGDMSYAPVWSFGVAKEPITRLVYELYERYGNDVRGICFRDWRIAGAYADVNNFMAWEFSRSHEGTLMGDMATDMFSNKWWEKRFEIMDFFNSMQRDFVASVQADIGDWPISVIVPSRALCLSSERTGRFDTWLSDDFSSFGWSKVGCLLDYSKSVDRAYELRSFEFLVASLQRFAEGASPLYRVDISASGDYAGLFNVLAKYDVTNVLLDDYEHWRLLSDQQVIDLKAAMNAASVTPVSQLAEVGFYLSSNSRDISYHDDRDVNRFSRAVQEFCITLLDKLPHRLRIYYDADVEVAANMRYISALVLFQSLNMSDDAVEAIGSLFSSGKGIVVIGRCGRYGANDSVRRPDLPFLDKFGEVDFGDAAYETEVTLKGGRIGAFDEVYALEGENVGIKPTRHIDIDDAGTDAIGISSFGDVVAVPIYIKGRDSMIAIDVLDESTLMDLASEMVLFAIGRDR